MDKQKRAKCPNGTRKFKPLGDGCYTDEQIKNHKKGIIIFSDFRHGIFNNQSINTLISSIKKNVFKKKQNSFNIKHFISTCF